MESQFVVSDIDFHQSLNEDNLTVSGIKTEEVKDDDLLLFSQLEQFRANVEAGTGFQVLQEANEDASLVFPESLGMGSPEFNTLLQDGNLNGSLCNAGNVKIESNSHYVKYKLQDGKHVKIWSCGICSKEFGHQYTLMRHLPTHTDERKFQCNTCGKAFRQMSTLSQHRAIHSSERPYVCEVCQKTFNRVSTLISHRKTHTGLKPHRCHLCNKAFHQKGNLRNHVFTHTNERPYKCDICEKGFNQMSNLMCHKFKAHQRADKPKYICRICGQDFPKRMGLRNHEQYQHGLNQTLGPPVLSEKLKYSNAIIVNPIKTEAMRLAIESNQTPFALLRPLTGIPVLVRVLPAGDKQMLIPATADDLKKHGQISITPKIVTKEDETEQVEVKENVDGKPNGSTVQIKIPVVATVIQQTGRDGLSMSVVSPGPNCEVVNKSETDSSLGNSYVYTSTLTDVECNGAVNEVIDLDKTKNDDKNFIPASIVNDAQIEFLDDTGHIMSEEEFRSNFALSGNTNVYQENDIIMVDSANSSRPNGNSVIGGLEGNSMEMRRFDNISMSHNASDNGNFFENSDSIEYLEL